MTYSELTQEARDYYSLCAQAEALGIPTSLDDPRSPKTVEALRAEVERVAASLPEDALPDPEASYALRDQMGDKWYLDLVRRRTVTRNKAEKAWKVAVCEAVENGNSLREVAEVAGVSHVRVLQITRQERSPSRSEP